MAYAYAGCIDDLFRSCGSTMADSPANPFRALACLVHQNQLSDTCKPLISILTASTESDSVPCGKEAVEHCSTQINIDTSLQCLSQLPPSDISSGCMSMLAGFLHCPHTSVPGTALLKLILSFTIHAYALTLPTYRPLR